MPLSGLEIYKLLPKTNCKACGFPTCLAFAMKLAQQGIELSACPHVSEQAKQALAASARPAMLPIAVGTGERAFTVGNETVMFRHQKTFVNPTALVVRVKASDPADAVAQTVSSVGSYVVNRVGINMSFNGIAVDAAGADGSAFASCVQQVASKSKLPLILMADKPDVMQAGLAPVKAQRPIIYAANKDNVAEMAKVAAQNKCPLAVRGASLQELADVVAQANKSGVEDIVLDPSPKDYGSALTLLTQIRRLALNTRERLMGYPVMVLSGPASSSATEETVFAGQLIAKYANIVVMDKFTPHGAYALLTQRLNIYTDPQKPIQVEPGVYPIRDPGKDSPVLVTTNFSLTYFSVAGEVEGSGSSAWLVICDADGLSVLTAWAAGKFDGLRIGKAVKGTGMADKVAHRLVVIPGHVAALSGETEEELPDWKVLVGPRESIDIPNYLKNVWAARLKESKN
jgi:acetyl-CoA decarbonylase/synthase complex subunit gamma